MTHSDLPEMKPGDRLQRHQKSATKVYGYHIDGGPTRDIWVTSQKAALQSRGVQELIEAEEKQ